MEHQTNSKLTVEAIINAPIHKVWKLWTEPEHIKNWNNASDDWHTPHVENDLWPGGGFLSKMAAKDGSFAFDFSGTYDEVKEHEVISYTLGDGRKVIILFSSKGNETTVAETFDAENTHSLEMQQSGWQAILNNFKKYVESN